MARKSKSRPDGFEALRWCDDGTIAIAGLPLVCHDLDELELEDEWTCLYCGKINLTNVRACGQGEWDGCGASRLQQHEQQCETLEKTRQYLSEVSVRYKVPGMSARSYVNVIAERWSNARH